MKFTKTFLAVAIAGIAAAPMVATADTTLSGVVEINFNGSDIDDIDAVPAVVDDPATAADETADAIPASSPGDIRIGTGDVLFGIVSEHALSNGLTGYGSLRVDLDRLSNEGNQTFDPFNTPGNDEDDIDVSSVGSADSVFVGIKGGFGDVRFGEIPLAVEFGQVANDIFDVGGEVSGGLSYSGTFGPVGIIANWSPEENQDVIGFGAKISGGGFSLSAGTEDRADNQNTAVGVGFAFAGAAFNAHFWTQEDAGDGDLESFSLTAAYAIGAFDAKLTISNQEDDGPIDDDAVRLDAGVQLGGGTYLSTRITSESDNNNSDNDIVSYRLQLAKSF